MNATNALPLPFMDQDENEFRRLLEIMQEQQPERILEIGVFKGGTLARFCMAFPYATVVGIDPRPEIDEWDVFHWGKLRLIHGASQSAEDMTRALSLLGGLPDVVHIDGDHTYDNAKADWEWAKKNARQLVAIHDVKSRGNPSIDCRRLWHEIITTEPYPWFEVSGTRDGAWGIGVVWMR